MKFAFSEFYLVLKDKINGIRKHPEPQVFLNSFLTYVGFMKPKALSCSLCHVSR